MGLIAHLGRRHQARSRARGPASIVLRPGDRCQLGWAGLGWAAIAGAQDNTGKRADLAKPSPRPKHQWWLASLREARGIGFFGLQKVGSRRELARPARGLAGLPR